MRIMLMAPYSTCLKIPTEISTTQNYVKIKCQRKYPVKKSREIDPGQLESGSIIKKLNVLDNNTNIQMNKQKESFSF